jgi:hypothetical protein
MFRLGIEIVATAAILLLAIAVGLVVWFCALSSKIPPMLGDREAREAWLQKNCREK